MTAEENAATVRAGFEAWNSKDWGQNLTVLDSNVETVVEATGQTLSGHQGWRQFWDQWNNAFQDNRVSIETLIADDTSVAVEGTFQGTHTGTMQTPAGDIPPTGKSVHTHFSAFYGMKNGKVSSYHIYFDTLTLMQQLGVAPQPEMVGA